MLSRDHIEFHEDGSLTVRLFGIKNDLSRSGFEVRIPGAANPWVDPGDCTPQLSGED